jgi:ABC-type transporter Mla maintaining outer membrane lipid asymmetry ATPase subunit MlaF
VDTVSAELLGVVEHYRTKRVPAGPRWYERMPGVRGGPQKVGAVQGLQHDPALLVLDEPTEGLDPPDAGSFAFGYPVLLALVAASTTIAAFVVLTRRDLA